MSRTLKVTSERIYIHEFILTPDEISSLREQVKQLVIKNMDSLTNAIVEELTSIGLEDSKNE